MVNATAKYKSFFLYKLIGPYLIISAVIKAIEYMYNVWCKNLAT